MGDKEFPFVVRHAQKRLRGVATSSVTIGGTEYFRVCCIKGGERTYGTWSSNNALPLPGIAPEELGYKTKFEQFYVKNIHTETVGIAIRQTYQNRRPAYAIRRPDGSENTKWYTQNCLQISKEEYDAADKFVKRRVWNAGMRGNPKLTGKERRCRECNKPITNGNWWYCGECHYRRTMYHPDVRTNMNDPR